MHYGVYSSILSVHGSYTEQLKYPSYLSSILTIYGKYRTKN